MKNKKKEIQINTYAKVLRRYLTSKGVEYVPSQTRYDYVVGPHQCTLTILGTKIKIENHTSKKIDIYDFNPKNNFVFTHSRFHGSEFEQLDLTQSEVYYYKDKLYVSSCAAIIETPLAEDKCANKLLFFSDMLVGATIYDTLNNIAALDGSRPISFTHDMPVQTTPAIALGTILKNEAKIMSSIKETRTR